MASPPSAKDRRERRLKISQPVRVRAEDFADTVQMGETLNMARNGLYLVCPENPFHIGMHIQQESWIRSGTSNDSSDIQNHRSTPELSVGRMVEGSREEISPSVTRASEGIWIPSR